VRPRRSTLFWIALFGLLVLIGTRDGLIGRTEDDRLDASIGGHVVRVIDGDTIRVRLDSPAGSRTVRYIGVDTPETHKPGTPVQCYGPAASAFNSRLLAGRRVELRTDAESRDRYGRLLAYVYRRPDGLFVNAELVRRGFATILTIPPNVAHAGEFLRLQRGAREAGRGLWSVC
jgi:micrococcal nuclease